MGPAEPYDALAALIERELQCVGERDFSALTEVKLARRALERTLPAHPPAEARGALQRCWMLHQRVRVELERVRESILLELAQVRHAQRAASGYAPARRRRLRVDARA